MNQTFWHVADSQAQALAITLTVPWWGMTVSQSAVLLFTSVLFFFFFFYCDLSKCPLWEKKGQKPIMWFFIGSLTPFINPANEIIPACVQTGRREFMAVFKLHTEGSLRLHLPRPSCLFFNHLSDALLSFLFLLSLCSWVIIFHQGGGRSDLLTQTKGCGWGGGRRQGWEEKRGEGREGEKRERSFPRLLLRKSCSSLQPEYSWAAEAATHCPLPLPPSCVSLQYNTDTSNKAKSPDWCVCACVCVPRPGMTSAPAAVRVHWIRAPLQTET